MDSILKILASVLGIVASYIIGKWLLGWVQRYQDYANKRDVEKESKKSDDLNQKLNDEWNSLKGDKDV